MVTAGRVPSAAAAPRVISASRRGDLPAYHTDWLLTAFATGAATFPHPYTRQPLTVALDPAAVLAVVYWSKHPAPLLPHLPGLRERGWPAYLQYTLTPYGAELEPGVPARNERLATFAAAARVLGPELVVWRYDPIVETPATPWAWHVAQFRELAAALAPHARRVVVSFYQGYPRADRRLARLGQPWRYLDRGAPRYRAPALGQPYTLPERRERAEELAALAAAEGLTLSVCADAELTAGTTLPAARCIDPALVALARGAPVTLPAHPSRPGCGCAASVDIGWYGACGAGCLYCYAG